MSPQRLPPSGSARQEASMAASLSFAVRAKEAKVEYVIANGDGNVTLTSHKAAKKLAGVDKEGNAARQETYTVTHKSRMVNTPNNNRIHDTSDLQLFTRLNGKTIGSVAIAPAGLFTEKPKAGNLGPKLVTAQATITNGEGIHAGLTGGQATMTFIKEKDGTRTLTGLDLKKPAPTM